MRGKPPRIGLFRSPARFRNFSMDGYADGMSAALRDQLAGVASIEEVRPGRSGEATRLSIVERIVDHGARYPQYLLQARRTRFVINHVMDQANAHLAYVLDPRRTIVTCHDIFPFKQWRGAIRGLERRMTPPVTVLASLSGLRCARTVLTSTQVTKDDLVRYLGLRPEVVYVVPYGIDAAFRPMASCHREQTRGTILVVDTGAAYKNQRATIEVLARAHARSEASVRLVRVGPPLREGERARARAYGVEHLIVELGSPRGRAEMASLYGRADVLLFPSFYEGFGWPPLEAMACGVPVVSSLALAVAEVVGDAALRADAEDYDGLTAHVLTALSDDAVRRSLMQRGRARAEGFAWDRAARAVSEHYRMILEERAA